MDYPKFIVSNQKEESIRIQSVKIYMGQLMIFWYSELMFLLIASWVIFHAFLLSADFFRSDVVRPDLGPNCSQKLSADDTRR